MIEWSRLALRDRIRPEFKIFNGNDLAIDMVMYGSDYLLGLSPLPRSSSPCGTASGSRGTGGSTR